ncbi:hypothetical protein LEMLEM_LOCUS1743 [Lemmus lemmus]
MVKDVKRQKLSITMDSELERLRSDMDEIHERICRALPNVWLWVSSSVSIGCWMKPL